MIKSWLAQHQIKQLIRTQKTRLSLLILGLFMLVAAMEFSTPSDYVFGYLYIGPILLANSWLNRISTLIFTLSAAILTILNLWVPGGYPIRASTIVSRLIAVLALVVTAILSDRHRHSLQILSQHQANLQAREQLISLREDFIFTLTHDLKTPLLGAIETLKALQKESFGPIPPAQKQVLAMMSRSHQNSLQLVETLLAVYRNDTQGLKLELAPVDLVTISEEVVSTLLDLASSRQVHISIRYGESDFRRFLWVNGDTLQLQRVFTNLLTNAINHSPRGGRVEIHLEPQSSYHVVKVLDMGAGITSEELSHLFERFYQGHSDRQAKGTGLGLYLTRQIVEAHHGSIWAENRQPCGAIFAFRLPALLFHTFTSN